MTLPTTKATATPIVKISPIDCCHSHTQRSRVDDFGPGEDVDVGGALGREARLDPAARPPPDRRRLPGEQARG